LSTGNILVGVDAEGRIRGPWAVADFAPAADVARLLSAVPELAAELMTGSRVLHVPDTAVAAAR